VILLLDNYDSFVFNLARYLQELGEEVRVVRNDAITAGEALAADPSHLVISPGPCTPRAAGVANELIRTAAGVVPILGVCLGHQCVGEVFGGRVVRAQPVHGKLASIHHTGRDLFEGLPSPFKATRYHSLSVDASALPNVLRPTAWTADGVLMALRHTELPVWGVQFHPEAVLTEHGHALLNNFLVLGRGGSAPGLAVSLPQPEISTPGRPAITPPRQGGD
jgi:anthranilate synthase component 2